MAALRTLFQPALASATPMSALGARAAFSSSARVLAEGSSDPAPSFRIRSINSPRTPQSGNESATRTMLDLLANRTTMRGRYRGNTPRAAHPSQNAAKAAEDLAKHKQALELTKQITRRWKTGDVYAPHDLSKEEMQKWKSRGRPGRDVVDVLGFDVKGGYKNFSMLAEYVTPMGRIKHNSETGLRPVNQRKIAKAVRRMVGMGFMPSVHRHPEILLKESLRRNEQLSRISKGPGM